MREMPTHMGATGNDRGAEGLSEVQESVLEHPSEETHTPQALDVSVQQKDEAAASSLCSRLDRVNELLQRACFQIRSQRELFCSLMLSPPPQVLVDSVRSKRGLMPTMRF